MVQEKEKEEILKRYERKEAKSRKGSNVLAFVIVLIIVFGLMFAFLFYTNQNVTLTP